ncbi:MAG: DUF2214 family protein [Hyphomonadaceae bacterium]
MALDAGLAIAHFFFVFVIVGALSGEMFVLRLSPSAPVLRLLARMDILYGAAAVGVIAAGAARVGYGLKDAAFYLGSHAFWAKMALFALVGALSIWPTIKYIEWNGAIRKDPDFVPPPTQWKAARTLVLIELHGLALMVVFAALMARALG